MIGFRRLPVRARLTAGFAAAMVAILAAIGLVLYFAMAAVLLDEIDTGLRARAATIDADLPAALHLATPTGGLIESQEAFAQVMTRDGHVVEASSGFPQPLLTADEARTIDHPVFLDRNLPGVAKGARLLAVPALKGSTSYLVIVGSSLSDRADALNMIQRFFLIGGPIALALACGVGWIVGGVALRPVERMRRQASAISAAGRDQRLSLPEADDELARLARTLNEMLQRIDDAARAERRFLDNASHELRTPLTALKAELDLAQTRPRTAAELAAVIESASEETDRLARMADDLLLLARARDGHLRIERAKASLHDLLTASAGLFQRRAAQTHIVIDVTAPQTPVDVDPRRVRQAVDNLIDNALRHTRTSVALRGAINASSITITVADDGPGLPEGFESRAFVPFERIDRHDHVASDGSEGAGLGLAIVRMIAESHDGTASAANAPGGGLTVTLTLPIHEDHSPRTS